MKKKFILLSFVFFILLSNSAFANSYDNNFKLRVGIYYGSKSRSSYTISGQDLKVNVNGTDIWNTYSQSLDITKVDSIYISNDRYETMEAALSNSNAVFYENGYYYPAGDNVSGNLNNQNNIKITKSNGEALIIQGDKNQYIKSSDDIVGINGAKYRDYASIYHDGSKIIAINVVGMDNYLKGVIAKEMPSSAHIEALKAQAVASRNFAITNINKFIKSGFNLCNTTVCQVYGGVKAETPNTNLAVDLTSGKLAYHNNDLAETYFHASSGGRTENAENIWGISRPYLVGVEDSESLGTQFDNWSVTMSTAEIRLQLQQNGINVGEIISLQPKYSENGRIIELTVNGRSLSYTIKRDRIRSVLGSSRIKSTYFTIMPNNISSNYYLSDSDFINSDSLSSTFKNLALIIDNENYLNRASSFSSGSYIINGKGYGHGVGLSQYGAMKMAKQGYTYEEILKHYYRGIEIR